MTRTLKNRDAATSLISVMRKVDWAKHHLDLLDDELKKFASASPYITSAWNDYESDEHVITLDTKQIPDEMGLILGDFVSCLRGSLDHLATSLAILGDDKSKRASFPVIGIRNHSSWRNFTASVGGISAEAVAVIDSFQPYHSGDLYKNTELWKLHRLWNIDKHRRIPIHSTKATMNVRCPPDVPFRVGLTGRVGFVRVALKDKNRVHLQGEAIGTVQFGEDEEAVVPYQELSGIYLFVRKQLIPAFKDFFIEPTNDQPESASDK